MRGRLAARLGRELLRCLWLDLRQGMQHSAIGQALGQLKERLGAPATLRPEDLDSLAGLPCAGAHLGRPCADPACWRRKDAQPPTEAVCLDCRGHNYNHAADCGLSFGPEFAQRRGPRLVS